MPNSQRQSRPDSENNSPLTVAVTGPIASGKSVVLSVAASMSGVETVDADRLAWTTYERGTSVYIRIVREFGSGVVDDRGKIDRESLGRIVFKDPQELAKLESIVHPVVMDKLRRMKDRLSSESKMLVVEGIKLLQSSHIDTDFFDVVILVDVDKRTRIERLRKRDELTPDQARRRVDSQDFSEEYFYEQADYVIRSDGSEQNTRAQAEEIFETILSCG